MNKYEKNSRICKIVEEIIKKKGYGEKLFLEPIENTFKNRPRYGEYMDGTLRFTIHMWDVNKLDNISLQEELEDRVREAIRYFKSKGKL
jgi:hypothetical protein